MAWGIRGATEEGDGKVGRSSWQEQEQSSRLRPPPLSPLILFNPLARCISYWLRALRAQPIHLENFDENQIPSASPFTLFKPTREPATTTTRRNHNIFMIVSSQPSDRYQYDGQCKKQNSSIKLLCKLIYNTAQSNENMHASVTY